MAKQKRIPNFTDDTREQLTIEGINASSRTLNYGRSRNADVLTRAKQRAQDLMKRATTKAQRRRIARAYAATGLIRPYYDDYKPTLSSDVKFGDPNNRTKYANRVNVWSDRQSAYTGHVNLKYKKLPKYKSAANGYSAK